MKLSELIEKYGNDNIKFQSLDSDIIEINKKKKHTEIKFGTSTSFNLDGTTEMGLVVWLDRDIDLFN